ncbi:5'/3'-nucleotidase SurE [Halostella pelagica]|uniref:5'/3'-nucleotidase SurE n=1 Tax=Halostella pelagica TaxID=2583824 RepID=UPI0010803D8B|nr:MULTISPECIES: 5'/3'-nucleotidase SurE [Halostella]
MVDILLTNDDGIDGDGLRALRDELRALGDVTVVAPADNQSGVGRKRSTHATLTEHEMGDELAGTPADCVAYGLRGMDREFDLVVSGCNHGPNMGAYVIGRSGTVGAALEAAFLGTPAVAVSAYHNVEFFPHPPADYDFSAPARVARELVERSLDAGVFDDVDLLNVNAPIDAEDPRIRVTRPDDDFDVFVDHDADVPDELTVGDGERHVALRDKFWPHTVGYENPFSDIGTVRERYERGSDRRAVIDGEVSVSPLTAPRQATHHEDLDVIVETLNAR